MMKTKRQGAAVIVLCLCMVSCRTPAEPVPIITPEGFIAVTTPQKALVAGIHRLVLGMSVTEVKTQLGNPAEERPGLLFYNLEEGEFGGYYVTARLFFDADRLSRAELGFGHKRRRGHLDD